MRLAAALGFGKDTHERVAYKTAEMQAQKEDAAAFRDEIGRETDALIHRLKAQARLGGTPRDDDAYPHTSH